MNFASEREAKQYNKNFNPEKEANHIIDEIKKYFAENGPYSKAIIGMSGGKDSTIVASLCVKALGKDKVFGVLMPRDIENEKQAKSVEMAEKICNHYGIDHVVIDIKNIYNILSNSITEIIYPGSKIEPTPITQINTLPRIRMNMLYFIANEFNGRVMNTSNYSEWCIGYCTKWGDMCGDFAPILNYTVSELLQIGEYLKIPNDFLYAIPEDGLTGRTDEENFGFTYKELDDFITFNKIPESSKNYNKIIDMLNKSKHKRVSIKVPRAERYYGYHRNFI